MGDYREALLGKQEVYYYENCGGCELDKKKAANPNIPWLHLFFTWIIAVSNALSIASVFPFLYYMVKDFNVAKREEDISFYAGFLGCACLGGRFLTAIPWGMVADRYGWKPVMTISTMVVVIFNVTFGLSTRYWMAIVSRFLIGSLNGLQGPIRAYACELSRKEHQPLSVAMLSSGWGVGLIVGPALGGYLAQPADKFPNVFSQESIFGRFPYFLVSLVISVFSLIVFVICFWIPETLHSHPVEPDDIEKPLNNEAKTSNSWVSLLQNWPMMSVVILFGIFQMQDIAFNEIFSLWTVSPRSLEGLGLGTSDVGEALSVGGVAMLVGQLLLYPFLERTLGSIVLCRVSVVVSIIVLACYPYIAELHGTALTIVVDLTVAVLVMLSCNISTSLFLLQNRAVPRELRGSANGISVCIVSLTNTIGPAAAGSILSWTQLRQNASFLPGCKMVFFILNMVKVVGLVLTFKPFFAKPAQDFD